MAEVLNRRNVKTLPDGTYQDAAVPRFYLSVKGDGKHRSYLFRYRKRGASKDTWLGLRSVAAVDLEQARDLARQYNEWLGQGMDPEDKRKPKVERTVSQLCDEYHAKFYGPHVRLSAGQKTQARGMLNNYILPAIGSMPVQDVTKETIWTTVWDCTDKTRKPLEAGAGLKPGTLEFLWAYKHQVGVHLRMHLVRMFFLAEQAGYLHGKPNPAESAWFKGMLKSVKRAREVQHHRAVPYKLVYRFLEAVRALRDGPSPKSLRYWGGPARQAVRLVPVKSMIIEMQVYTGVRHAELRQAQWKEIDWNRMTWTPPPSHVKNKRERPIPITPKMVKVLNEARARTGTDDPETLIFPGMGGKVIGASQMKVFITKQVKWESEVDPHGARSMLKDWLLAETEYSLALFKIQVDQKPEGQVDQAYGHNTQLARRRRMMNEWDTFCGTWPPPLRDPEEEEDVLPPKAERAVLIDIAGRRRSQ